jgi:Mn-dependent DtxR family transcriptional regulator
MAKSTIKKIQKAISDLDEERLDKVLHYVEELRQSDLINQRAQVSEEDIQYGRVVSLDQFNQDFAAWKEKRKNIG